MTEKGPVSWVCFKTISSASMSTGVAKISRDKREGERGRGTAGDMALPSKSLSVNMKLELTWCGINTSNENRNNSGVWRRGHFRTCTSQKEWDLMEEGLPWNMWLKVGTSISKSIPRRRRVITVTREGKTLKLILETQVLAIWQGSWMLRPLSGVLSYCTVS